ncbi:Asp-tRNA(Asn)/Glu-tRNA(Gln) amidotransferase subunit GatB [Marinicella gelatinilytica]|uniref:Asp-tRNA(Asn)/Glu-tRNA(Gln) amidotransferase subunit GatB n=1 Tax=Marinicella gelatinilytica TaxID=2996017 RepID=UPI0022608915|nr:Asp-tRNA(Asn)/Glu-tRNA(Gln) amidotransferase subunit GatB [Marinicella gelatinilytica]MCX7545553.1 Asp-tRNA(Asn)/Glu-tRNA(Gln) amidotransferase subunit GatB [Marinicella gelatinilytica]
MSQQQWDVVIGLEIHVRLALKSKLFSGASAQYGATPNSQVSFLDAALPGTLPVVNSKAIEYALRFGLSIDAEIPEVTRFARKNYFYPDLPKGYQISQMDDPIVGRGRIEIDTGKGRKSVNITRAHLEEDAGKSIHDQYDDWTAIDLNRAGTALIEVVSEPELYSAKEAVAYMRAIYNRVTFLGICDGNLQEGSFRCDANVSLKPKGGETLGTRAEVKNLNSFRFIEKAINFEIKRQAKLLESGEKVVQETRLYDAEQDVTRSMRGKEDANDYRYFPDPDLPALKITADMLDKQRASMPELPEAKLQRYIQEWNLPEDNAAQLAYDVAMSGFFEHSQALTKATAADNAKFLITDFNALLNEQSSDMIGSQISAENYAGLLDAMASAQISRKIAKQVLTDMWHTGKSAQTIIEAQGLAQISDSNALKTIIQQVVDNNPKQVEQYRSGNEKMFNFFIGQVMKQTKGQANPVQTKQILEELLSNE